MTNWNDFNDSSNELNPIIPQGTLAKVEMRIKRGEHNDPTRNWTGGYATRNPETGSVYLNACFTVLNGEYAQRQVWSKIGLHSEKSEEWSRMGRRFVRDIVNSAYRLDPFDKSEDTKKRRMVRSFAELDGLQFVAQIDVEQNKNGNHRNIIKTAVTPDKPKYEAHMTNADMVVGPAIWGGDTANGGGADDLYDAPIDDQPPF